MVSDSVDVGSDVGIYLSDKFPGDADAPTLGEPRLRLLCVPFSGPKCHVRNPLKSSDTLATAAYSNLDVILQPATP